ncbi:M81 family metallopeptidase [Brachybacterium halotolerans subsp. kimchii]|uniref:M81 family metallopeptidase n=1 Tax=Brachybacterium halotolerans TaxID=2795215 RepID=UPI001E51B0FD|nr:M81 family metallopeptidase [Brachybacterium halotolerans]UEJ81446.1 M81 family metallopeptidase [Brachybacterium halotolerans subsp. kimchii]
MPHEPSSTRPHAAAGTALPRIAVCGIHIESSTFTPYVSTAVDFDVRRGDAVLERHPFLAAGSPLREAAAWHGVLHAGALPGGPLDRADFEAWCAEILEGLAALVAGSDGVPLDALWFDIHGAMSVRGMDDAEGALITAIREVIGEDVLVGTSMDLHGNVSPALFAGCDQLTCYRTAPHVDVAETRERAVRSLLDALAAAPVDLPAPKPHRALVHVPILLPGEMTSTRVEPAASLYARIPELAAREGVTDVSYWIGFAWADEPRCQAAVVAFGADGEAVDAAALELATAIWEARHDFVFVAPTGTLEECLDTAVASPARPFWISDSGDNPGAGGADDTTGCLAALAARPEIRAGEVTALLVSIVDPETAGRAAELGVGRRGDVVVGGRIDARDPGPVPLHIEVEALDHSPATGVAAVLRVLAPAGGESPLEPQPTGKRPTGLRLVVTSRRAQFSTGAMFARLGLTMTGADVVVVKMGYLEPDQHAAAADWMMALTPGGVDQDLVRLGHRRITRPMLPFDAEIPAPSAADVLR